MPRPCRGRRVPCLAAGVSPPPRPNITFLIKYRPVHFLVLYGVYYFVIRFLFACPTMFYVSFGFANWINPEDGTVLSLGY